MPGVLGYARFQPVSAVQGNSVRQRPRLRAMVANTAQCASKRALTQPRGVSAGQDTPPDDPHDGLWEAEVERHVKHIRPSPLLLDDQQIWVFRVQRSTAEVAGAALELQQRLAAGVLAEIEVEYFKMENRYSRFWMAFYTLIVIGAGAEQHECNARRENTARLLSVNAVMLDLTAEQIPQDVPDDPDSDKPPKEHRWRLEF